MSTFHQIKSKISHDLSFKRIPVPEMYGWSSTTDNRVGWCWVRYHGTCCRSRSWHFSHELWTCDEADHSSMEWLKKYVLAIAEKKAKSTKPFGKPFESDFPHNTVFSVLNSHRGYIELLKKYIEIARYLLRNLGNNLSRPTLRHPGTSTLQFSDPLNGEALWTKCATRSYPY